MAQRGIKPTSPAEKAARGNPSGRKLTKVVELDGLLAVAPYWLDSQAAGIWERVVKEIQDKDMLVNLDRDLLGMYCQHISNGIAAQTYINDNGLTDSKGKKHDEVLIMRDSFDKARLVLSELGLTPSGRFRGIHGGKGDKETKDLAKKYGVGT